ncbi:unnamed protein product [Acanthoscelides obtectus]|uniref:Uncharacterized protein n=1 Tax=Acanthoscelides obtectus TaxID=200917 RepID=A0A9P0Q9B6_ACAOB|nr:unnamed protein product [Acanthoscelides obtectus]CAK1682221.1 hypothetical protein AOBTE_LOCUS33494 [Acanthoscelides obtectus]
MGLGAAKNQIRNYLALLARVLPREEKPYFTAGTLVLTFSKKLGERVLKIRESDYRPEGDPL